MNKINTLNKYARYLRKNMTYAENRVWYYLRIRQYAIGNYIVDFICREKNLVIEIDGGCQTKNVKALCDGKYPSCQVPIIIMI